MKKLENIILIALVVLVAGVVAVEAAPTSQQLRTIIPETDSTYDLGSSAKRWANIYVDSCTGCSSASQTPWTQDIDGDFYDLASVLNITATNIFATGTLEVAGATSLYDGLSLTTFSATSSSATSTVTSALQVGDHLASYGVLSANNIAATGTVQVGGLTASRLLSTGLTKNLASVSDLTSWIAGTSGEIGIADDGDGSVTLSIAAALDLGGNTSVEIPNGTDPTVNATGEIAVNTTTASTSVVYYDGASEQVLSPWFEPSGVFASSSPDDSYNKFGNGATSTFRLANYSRATELLSFYCKTESAGTVLVRFGDGTSWTEDAECTTSGVEQTLSSNNTFNIREDIKVQIGESATDPDNVTITAKLRINE